MTKRGVEGQIVSPLRVNAPPTTERDDPQRMVDGPETNVERDSLAKGPLSGMIPGGGESATTTTATPTSTSGSSLPSGILGGLPGGGLPGTGSSQEDGQNNPTLVLGGFSILLMPMRGMSLSNIMPMLSAGQQVGQMLPKPTGRSIA